MLHTHFHLHFAVTKKTKGEVWELCKGQCTSEIGKHWLEKKIVLFHVPLDFVRGIRIICVIRNYKFGVKRNTMDSGIFRFPKAINI
jgi:hypothetical protein